MSILPIVTYNDPVLREKAAPVTEMNDVVRRLIDDMMETMYHSNGVGLAAPQIGESLQIFVTNSDPMTEEFEDEPDVGEMVFINPEIISLSGDKIRMEEGCLSLPTLRDDVNRPDEVRIRFLDREMNPQELTATGWFSRVIQHEYDHLQGVLFIDYLSLFRRRMQRALLRKIDAGQVEMEYPLRPRGVGDGGLGSGGRGNGSEGGGGSGGRGNGSDGGGRGGRDGAKSGAKGGATTS